jgi:hypothetical protein
MRQNEEKNTKIVLEIYQEIYENSTPKGDFAKMMETGETEKQDFFLNYVCPEQKQKEIIENILDKYKVKKNMRDKFYKEIILGCSPKYE